MKVFVTGATGFVGAHTALALLDAGHELRLLVRDEKAAQRWFAARGHRIERFVTVDICDQAAVKHAMAGCDAVFHAAAAVSLDPRRAGEIYLNNVGATKAVLGSARALGIRNLLYVSSVTALFHPGAARIDETTPLTQVTDAYSRSKRDSDEYVRELQKQGVPVQITYPAGVIGPDDPKLSVVNQVLLSWVGRQMVLRTTTGFQCVDVRDLAQIHRWLLQHPLVGDFENGRYVVGGNYYPWAELPRHLEALLGRRIRGLRLSPKLLRAIGIAVDLVKRLVPFETQISAESMAITTQWPHADSSRILTKSGLRFRSSEETFSDTIRWLVEADHLSAKKAGRLGIAGTAPSSASPGPNWPTDTAPPRAG
ncbi:NAD-dependent epimerase/dehydratase family protein [Mycobacterium sp.]|uniref:NAD-dependent epimerase/dehydratase family protein n=1 Tax=Mycobacterium sp. TaxID=1785 RepID=UPI003BAA1AB8